MVGQKEKKVKDWGRNREREEEKKGERHLQTHTGREVWKLGCHSYLVTAVEQVSDCRFDLFELRGRCRFLQITPRIFVQRQQEVIFGLKKKDWL